MKRFVALAALLALSACEFAQDPMNLTCDTFGSVDMAELTRHFGATNVVDQTLPGPEGIEYQATVVFPNDATRRVEIVWDDATTKQKISSVAVRGEISRWVGPQGVTLGASIAEVENKNGKPFKLWGFDWDYGGWVSDWQTGAFAAPGCLTQMRFAPHSSDYSAASGDGEFASDEQSMRAADPRVAEFGVSFQLTN